jgi:hypothetical protein
LFHEFSFPGPDLFRTPVGFFLVQGIATIAAPVLALPLILHKRSMMSTEQMLRQQIVRPSHHPLRPPLRSHVLGSLPVAPIADDFSSAASLLKKMC